MRGRREGKRPPTVNGAGRYAAGPMPPLASLCLFWLLYMESLGVFFPFFGLYLKEGAGLDGFEAGMVLGTIPLLGALAQVTWGQLADRRGARSRVLTLVVLGTALGQLGVWRASGLPALVAATAALAVFSTAVIPMAVSVTLALVAGRGRHGFGLARACGTIGFGITVFGFPRLLRAWADAPEAGGPAPEALSWMFPATALLAALACAVSLALPREGAAGLRARPGALRGLLAHPPMRRLLLWTFGVFLFLHGPMSLFPLFVRALGGGMEDLSGMWLVMLLLEVPLIALSGTLVARSGPRFLLATGALAAGLRWTASAGSGDLGVVTGLGVLHGVVVTGITIGGPLYVEAAVPPALRSTGQALLAMVGPGLGGMASSLACGWLLDAAGARAAYGCFGAGALALGLAVAAVLPPALPPTPVEPGDEAAAPAAGPRAGAAPG